MDTGFLKISAVSPLVSVADIKKNTESIIKNINDASKMDVQILTFPELVLTSASLGDLFLQSSILAQCESAISEILNATNNLDILVCFGAPIYWNGSLYDCGILIQKGKIIAVIPKNNFSQNITNQRQFSSLTQENMCLSLCGQRVPFGSSVIHLSNKASMGVIFYDDLVDGFPITKFSKSHVNLLLCLSAQPYLVSQIDDINSLLKVESKRNHIAIAYASSGVGESSTDNVYSGYCAIYENGNNLSYSELFLPVDSKVTNDVDIDRCIQDQIKNNSATSNNLTYKESYISIPNPIACLPAEKIKRSFPPLVFVPQNPNKANQKAEEILQMQSVALAKRMMHIGIQNLVLGLSGGLDSTLAFLVALRTLKRLQLPYRNLICITLPGFGTTDRTYQNSLLLANSFNCTLLEISIADATLQHFKDIQHDPSVRNATYENAQARERTQILMDIANDKNALLIGTGDLSELALGWCTFNADHMSMYGVNADIPKTFVKFLVSYEAQQQEQAVETVLNDILSTPISPELLPPSEDGHMQQKTENTLGPYEVHDFYLYYFLRYGFSPEKLLFMAERAFQNKYSIDQLKKWLKIFIKRFFQNQFKRSCLPDGPKIGSVSISPRGDFMMPSDASPSSMLDF